VTDEGLEHHWCLKSAVLTEMQALAHGSAEERLNVIQELNGHWRRTEFDCYAPPEVGILFLLSVAVAIYVKQPTEHSAYLASLDVPGKSYGYLHPVLVVVSHGSPLLIFCRVVSLARASPVIVASCSRLNLTKGGASVPRRPE